MAMTLKDTTRIAEIINHALNKCDWEFKGTVSPSDIRSDHYWKAKELIDFEEGKCPFDAIFNKLSKNRFKDYGQFNHYKSCDLALKIIVEKSIQVSNLASNDNNDFSEYSEFYKRIGLLYQLLPKDYRLTPEGEMMDPGAVTPADQVRKEIFILCLTQDNHNERFWREYASNDSGVAIGFRFSHFDPNLNNALCYDLRDVYYDEGYSVDFINEINYHIRKEFKKIAFSGGITTFSKFYKRDKYRWENETRLCFDYDKETVFGKGHTLEQHFPIEHDIKTGRTYIDLPLKGNAKKNPFFELEITEVVCGKYVSDPEFEALKMALKASYFEAKIWRRV
jgi:hypothetical protein